MMSVARLRQLASTHAGVVLAFAGATAFSAKAILVKLCYRYGTDAETVLMFRMLFALPFFLLMGWWAQRGKSPLRQNDYWQAVGVGVLGYYLASYLDFLGLQFVTASLERLILYLNPTMVLILGWLLYGRRIGLWQAAGMAISYAGVLAVFAQELGLQGDAVGLGAILVFGAALSYALYMVLGEGVIKKLGSLRMAGVATSTACVLCIAQFLVLRPLSAANVPVEVVWLSMLNATLCTALPVLLILMAIERVGAALTAQIGMVGPMSTILLGVWLLDEPFNNWVVLGTILVLVGVFAATRTKGSSA